MRRQNKRKKQYREQVSENRWRLFAGIGLLLVGALFVLLFVRYILLEDKPKVYFQANFYPYANDRDAFGARDGIGARSQLDVGDISCNFLTRDVFSDALLAKTNLPEEPAPTDFRIRSNDTFSYERDCRASDVFVAYLAGHCYVSPTTNELVIRSTEETGQTEKPIKDIFQALASNPAGRKILLLDWGSWSQAPGCYERQSGGEFASSLAQALGNNDWDLPLDQGELWVVLSHVDGQRSRVLRSGRTVFCQAIGNAMQTLRAAEDEEDRDIGDFYLAIRRHMFQLAHDRRNQALQIPLLLQAGNAGGWMDRSRFDETARDMAQVKTDFDLLPLGDDAAQEDESNTDPTQVTLGDARFFPRYDQADFPVEAARLAYRNHPLATVAELEKYLAGLSFDSMPAGEPSYYQFDKSKVVYDAKFWADKQNAAFANRDLIWQVTCYQRLLFQLLDAGLVEPNEQFKLNADKLKPFVDLSDRQLQDLRQQIEIARVNFENTLDELLNAALADSELSRYSLEQLKLVRDRYLPLFSQLQLEADPNSDDPPPEMVVKLGEAKRVSLLDRRDLDSSTFPDQEEIDQVRGDNSRVRYDGLISELAEWTDTQQSGFPEGHGRWAVALWGTRSAQFRNVRVDIEPGQWAARQPSIDVNGFATERSRQVIWAAEPFPQELQIKLDTQLIDSMRVVVFVSPFFSDDRDKLWPVLKGRANQGNPLVRLGSGSDAPPWLPSTLPVVFEQSGLTDESAWRVGALQIDDRQPPPLDLNLNFSGLTAEDIPAIDIHVLIAYGEDGKFDQLRQHTIQVNPPATKRMQIEVTRQILPEQGDGRLTADLLPWGQRQKLVEACAQAGAARDGGAVPDVDGAFEIKVLPNVKSSFAFRLNLQSDESAAERIVKLISIDHARSFQDLAQDLAANGNYRYQTRERPKDFFPAQLGPLAMASLLSGFEFPQTGGRPPIDFERMPVVAEAKTELGGGNWASLDWGPAGSATATGDGSDDTGSGAGDADGGAAASADPSIPYGLVLTVTRPGAREPEWFAVIRLATMEPLYFFQSETYLQPERWSADDGIRPSLQVLTPPLLGEVQTAFLTQQQPVEFTFVDDAEMGYIPARPVDYWTQLSSRERPPAIYGSDLPNGTLIMNLLGVHSVRKFRYTNGRLQPTGTAGASHAGFRTSESAAGAWQTLVTSSDAPVEGTWSMARMGQNYDLWIKPPEGAMDESTLGDVGLELMLYTFAGGDRVERSMFQVEFDPYGSRPALLGDMQVEYQHGLGEDGLQFVSRLSPHRLNFPNQWIRSMGEAPLIARVMQDERTLMSFSIRTASNTPKGNAPQIQVDADTDSKGRIFLEDIGKGGVKLTLNGDDQNSRASDFNVTVRVETTQSAGQETPLEPEQVEQLFKGVQLSELVDIQQPADKSDVNVILKATSQDFFGRPSQPAEKTIGITCRAKPFKAPERNKER